MGTKKKKKTDDYDRGRIETIVLKKQITFNGFDILKAVVEIDHINHGLDTKTKKLSTSKRTNFSLKDIEKFIMLLDGEFVMADNYIGRVSQFSIRINCPIKGKFYNKEFIMICDTDYDKQDEIHTITLYPGW